MARPLRILFPDALYHVTARGNEQKPIVRDDEDRQRFVRTLAEMIEQYQVICYAWVLLDNHYHLLIETPAANLSKAIRHLNGVYTQRFNRRHERAGHLFQGRFKAILIQKETYLLELSRYIVLNPVRAGMVKHPKSWPWSSYRATAGEEAAPSWLRVEELISAFGNPKSRAKAAYRRFVDEAIAVADSPWLNLTSGIYLGEEAFLKEVQRRLKATEDHEIPRAQKAPAAPRIEALLAAVANIYAEKEEVILAPTRRPGEARQAAIYLARRAARLDLKVISKLFGLSYTGVSRRVGAIAKRIEEDQRFKTKLNKILMSK